MTVPLGDPSVIPGHRLAAGALGPQAETARHWNGGRFTVNIARSLLWLNHHRAGLEQALT